MSEEVYFETSFRFKWGIGFFIEMLEEGLQEFVPTQAITYALENQVFSFDPKEKHFIETEEEITESSATNFVLKIEKEDFDHLVQVVGLANDSLKPQLITEFGEKPKNEEEKKRLELLHKTYDEMNFLDAILSYTALTITFPDEHTILIQDPQPQKQNEDFQMI